MDGYVAPMSTRESFARTELMTIQRVRDMVLAANRAHLTNDQQSDASKQFRTFIFMFANTFLHETGHILLTFLAKGRSKTPTRMNVQNPNYSTSDRGESGRNFETIMFGGTLEYFREHTQDDSQVFLLITSLSIVQQSLFSPS